MAISKLAELLNGYDNVSINDLSCNVSQTKRGIFFFYCTWSPTFIQLQTLLSSLTYWSPIPIFIFDIDEEGMLPFMERQQLSSHGWGETYWVRDGRIMSFLKKYDKSSLEQLVKNNSML